MPSYASIMPWLSAQQSFKSETTQFKMWTEHLLVRLCQLSDQSNEVGQYTEPVGALKNFRFWARYWDSTGKNNLSEGPNAAKYRRLAWKAYYDTLSSILRSGRPYSPEPTTLVNDFATEKAAPRRYPTRRLQQRAELKRVESVYESLLLQDTHFPKASENNRAIEAWADSVMDNWRFLCGPKWTDEDLGEGGKEAVGRGVLDVSHVRPERPKTVADIIL